MRSLSDWMRPGSRPHFFCALLRLAGFLMLASTGTARAEQAYMAPEAEQAMFLDLARLDSGSVVAVGERGIILKSDADGGDWAQAPVPTRATLTSVVFIDDQRGWAAGHDQTILHTTDGGASWQLQHESDDQLQPAVFDIWFADANRGLAIGAYGLFLVTRDGGKSWQNFNLDNLEDPAFGLPHFYAISEGPDGKLLMAGEAGLLAFSDDQGRTWRKLESPYIGSWFGASWQADGTLYVLGLRGHFFRSVDEGRSWSRLPVPTTAGLNDVLLHEDGRMLVAGLNGVILYSEDGGRSFQLTQRNDRKGINALVSLNNHLILAGEGGVRDSDLTGKPRE